MYKIGNVCYDRGWGMLGTIGSIRESSGERSVLVIDLRIKFSAWSKDTDLIPMTLLDLYLLTGKGIN